MAACTTIEQSKRLLELGFDPNSADMVYLHQGLKDNRDYYSLDCYPWSDDCDNNDIPAWSLDALIEIMPKSIYMYDPNERCYKNYSINMFRSWYHCCSYCFGPSLKEENHDQLCGYGGDTWIEAVIGVIEQLAKYNLLKRKPWDAVNIRPEMRAFCVTTKDDEREELLTKICEWMDNELCCYVKASEFSIDLGRLKDDFKKEMKARGLTKIRSEAKEIPIPDGNWLSSALKLNNDNLCLTIPEGYLARTEDGKVVICKKLKLEKGKYYVATESWTDDGWTKFYKGVVLKCYKDDYLIDRFDIEHYFGDRAGLYFRQATENEIPKKKSYKKI